MKNFKPNIFRFFIVILIFSFFIFNFVRSDEVERADYIYLFHLYYDNGQLLADRDFEFKYDVLPEKFMPENITVQFPYRGEVVNLLGEVAQQFQFDPKVNNPLMIKGKTSVKAPYVSDGQKVNFYDSQGNSLLTIFVSDSSICNDNGTCNEDTGENTQTCPYDCSAGQSPNIPVATPGSSDQSDSSGKTGVAKALIYLIIGLGIGGGWYWFRYHKSKEDSYPMQFPQNPNV